MGNAEPDTTCALTAYGPFGYVGDNRIFFTTETEAKEKGFINGLEVYRGTIVDG